MTSPRILVVDDEPDVRRVTALLLRQGGYDTVEVNSGDEALNWLARAAGQVDLIVTDQRMPGMTGEEFAREATVLYPALRILFVTGYSTDSVSPATLSGDQYSILEKPFTLAQLLGRVRDLLGS